MIYEFTKSRSTAIAQIEPQILDEGFATINTIYNNQESFKDHFNVSGNLFNGNQLKPQIIDLIQKYDTAYLQWHKSIFDTQYAYLKLNGV